MKGLKMKTQLGPSNIFFPVPAALVGCGTVERSNIVTVAWVGTVGSLPPVISISLRNSRYSLELIRQAGEYTVNIPSAEQFKEADYCGIVSGKDTDKFADTKFTAVSGQKVKAPIVKECPFNLECKVVGETNFGQWVAIFGEVVETHVDSDKIDASTGKIDIAKVNPLVYCATIREYWRLGEKLGKGFNAGKEILQKKRI